MSVWILAPDTATTGCCDCPSGPDIDNVCAACTPPNPCSGQNGSCSVQCQSVSYSRNFPTTSANWGGCTNVQGNVSAINLSIDNNGVFTANGTITNCNSQFTNIGANFRLNGGSVLGVTSDSCSAGGNTSFPAGSLGTYCFPSTTPSSYTEYAFTASAASNFGCDYTTLDLGKFTITPTSGTACSNSVQKKFGCLYVTQTFTAKLTATSLQTGCIYDATISFSNGSSTVDYHNMFTASATTQIVGTFSPPNATETVSWSLVGCTISGFY